MTSDQESAIVLPDGRTLGYATWGDPDGTPVVCLHGCPGSRFNAASFSSPARDAGLQIIAPERPGYGLSSPSHPRILTQWPDDLVCLANSLGLQRFHLAGASGGGPHALVCGAKIPERIRSLTVISSLAPLDSPNATLGMDPTLRRLWRSDARLQRFLIRTLATVSRWAPDSALIPTRDSHAMKFFGPGEIREAFIADMREALRDGGRAMAAEVAMLSRPWGFDLEEIQIPVRLWHGALDANCPRPMAEYLLEKLPNATGSIFEDEGHLCAFERLGEFFKPFAA